MSHRGWDNSLGAVALYTQGIDRGNDGFLVVAMTGRDGSTVVE